MRNPEMVARWNFVADSLSPTPFMCLCLNQIKTNLSDLFNVFQSRKDSLSPRIGDINLLMSFSLNESEEE